MASINDTIDWLEKLPEDIKETGKNYVRQSILDCGNYDNGDMYKSVRGSASSNHVKIEVWCAYATYVNYGHGPSYPHKYRGVHIKPSYKWYGSWVHHTKGYDGSKFFDTAYDNLYSYIKSL